MWGIPYLHSNSRTTHRGYRHREKGKKEKRSRVREIGTQRGIDGMEVGSPPGFGMVMRLGLRQMVSERVVGCAWGETTNCARYQPIMVSAGWDGHDLNVLMLW